VKINRYGIPCFGRIIHSVNNLVFLLGIGAKQSVPHNKEFPKILVEVAKVDAMMYAVM
jgi:hypothetical protein